MEIFLNILFVLSIIGTLIGCTYGDYMYGCAGSHGHSSPNEKECNGIMVIAVICIITAFIVFAIARKYGILLLGFI